MEAQRLELWALQPPSRRVKRSKWLDLAAARRRKTIAQAAIATPRFLKIVSRLMEAYYRNLLAGQGRATALREAMRWLRATKPEPHYWAPFIALGRDAPLRELGPHSQKPPKR